MNKFMDKDFLLSTDTAKHLYHDYAEAMPIIDYHCHLSPRAIYENKRYENITQLWLGEDHYKWRLMRANGIDERYITGDAPDREKFQKWAETLEIAIGNPLYHWSHLELKKYFGYEGCLDGDTAEEVWNLCNEKLAHAEMSTRNLIFQSNVKAVCTTDDPADSLEWHKKIAEDNFAVKIYPAWRPDKAMSIEKDGYLEYLKRLEIASGSSIQSFSQLISALKKRMDYFEKMGCCISDHGLEYVMFVQATENEVEDIFKKRLMDKKLSRKEELQFKTAFMVALGKEYARRNWVMQLHFGVQRDLNKKVYEQLGPDAGIDAINNFTSSTEMGQYLNALAYRNALPKTIIYSLNPTDNASIETVIGCFQDSSDIGKIQHGAAWWFNDNRDGMVEQMMCLANSGLLANFVGMLTDSRSFLSYARHEYFRRILCNMIGNWVEGGEYSNNDKYLKRIVENICYYNAKRYFRI